VRAVVIRADHPEPEHALRNGLHELIVDGMPVSIRLHLIMHDMVASELAGDDPPGGVLDRAADARRGLQAPRAAAHARGAERR
jgi:hypothetical protein